jgi:hypothetical protein
MKKIVAFFLTAIVVIGLVIILNHIFILDGRTIQISDVTKKNLITLSSEKNQKRVNGIRINITGHINGKATISQYEQGKKIKTLEIGKGAVSVRLVSEWYNNDCDIEYEPFDVKNGELQIKYKFDGL